MEKNAALTPSPKDHLEALREDLVGHGFGHRPLRLVGHWAKQRVDRMDDFGSKVYVHRGASWERIHEQSPFHIHHPATASPFD